jgi:MFS family permease
LKIMIGALLFTGACGVLAVLTGSWDIVGRVMLSSIVAAIAAGMMMPIAGWIDDEETRPSGLWGIALIVLQFVFFIGAIWIDYNDIEWRLLATGFILFPVGWPAIWVLAVKGKSPLTVSAGTALFSFFISGLAFVAGIWWPKITLGSTGPYTSDADWKLIASGAVIYFYSLVAAMALSQWSPDHKHPWRWLGPLGALISIAVCLAGIWMSTKDRTPVLDISTGLAVFCAHAIVLLNLPLGTGVAPHRLRLVAILLSATTIAMICTISVESIYTPSSNWDTTFNRLTGAGAILTICATLALLITARLSRGINLEPSDALAMDALVDLFCPRCKTRQSLPVGESACKQCDLRITTKIQEPRCPHCDYLLYKNTTGACPECGKPIIATPHPQA